jgi:alcohol dehydrogenase class IV
MSEIITGASHVFHSPPKIIFGLGTAKAVSAEVNRLGGTKVLIVTDPILMKENVIEPVIESLKAVDLPYAIFDGVEPDPPAQLVDDATKQLHEEKCDFIIGIGGASSLDVAKGVSVAATNEGGVLSLIGIEQVTNRSVPKVLISTTHSAGGELSPIIVMHLSKEDHTVIPIISEYVIPDVAIMDPLLTVSMPPTLTVDTGIDSLATAIEAYVATDATHFSDVLAERAIELGTEYLPVVWAKGSNVTARYYMSLTATLAGMAFVSASVGAVHALSYSIASAYHLTHGRSLAVLLPHVMSFNLPGNPERYARVAMLMGKEIEGLSTLDAAEMAVEGVEEILDAVEVSYRLRDYGASEEDLPRLTEETMEMAAFFDANPRDFNEDDVKAIYEAAL